MNRSSEAEQRRAYPSVAAFYAYLMPMLTKRARDHGYALAVHGSMATDLDLVAIPWTESACAAEELVESLRHLVGGFIHNDPEADPYSLILHNPNPKPHGRRAWSIYISHDLVGPYIDLSVMPLNSTPLNSP